LEWKVRIFIIAAALGLAGIYLEEKLLTGAAILLLLGGVALRSLGGAGGGGPEDGEGGEGAP
jgi:hypothetical protein